MAEWLPRGALDLIEYSVRSSASLAIRARAAGALLASTSVPLAARVRRMLVEDLGQVSLTADVVAKALAMSRRTLTRRLREEGTSFRAILDDVRAELAVLRAGRVSPVVPTLDRSDAAEVSSELRRRGAVLR